MLGIGDGCVVGFRDGIFVKIVGEVVVVEMVFVVEFLSLVWSLFRSLFEDV